MHYKTGILPALLVLMTTAPLYAADISHGKSLQQENCMGCHDDGMYTRDNRRVNSMDSLQKQVTRCEQSLGLKWFDDDVSAVTDYLNTSFYHFK